MEYERILSAIAPCGLSCETCFARVDGGIHQLSRELREKLGNFSAYAKRFENMLEAPVFEKYPDFEAMLDYFCSNNCNGCRSEQCRLFKDCGIRPCHQEKGVDFCFQCEEFPCSKTNFDESLRRAWVLINEKIRKTGIEQYYEKTRRRPRYV
ncbi:MAG: DUF3795 domain-containing protein [Syntrophobacteraceae bacterium]|nr:DUF3795 domain-containing protein [Syntrophobacteraceae bacterium]